jgi:hypothetical protein
LAQPLSPSYQSLRTPRQYPSHLSTLGCAVICLQQINWFCWVSLDDLRFEVARRLGHGPCSVLGFQYF